MSEGEARVVVIALRFEIGNLRTQHAHVHAAWELLKRAAADNMASR
jgi:hypothetical protein